MTLNNPFKYFSYFYSMVGHRMLVAISGSILIGFLDGLGLAMFMPLLQSVDGQINTSSENLGNLVYLIHGLENMGISLTLNSILLVMLTFFMAKGLFRFLEGYYKVGLTQFFIINLRLKNVELISNYTYSNFVNADAGRIQNTLTGEMGRVTSAFGYYLSAMQSATLLSVYVTLAFLANPEFAFLISVGAFLSNFLFKKVYKITVSISRSITNVGHKYQSLLIQMVSHFKYLQASGTITSYKQKLDQTICDLRSFAMKSGYYNVILLSVREPLVILVVIAVILIEINVLGQTLGVIILSLLFFYRALNFVIGLQTQWNSFLNNQGALENLDEFQLELESAQLTNNGLEFKGIDRSIIVTNLSFCYSNVKVLKKINVEIFKNQTVAFVGESGSGKTTLINILAGLIKPEDGHIHIDEIPLHNFKIRSFQKRIGYITQEAVIFNDTIFNNVTFWQPKTPENYQRFLRAVEQASITDYINGLDEKEDALLGNNGINLSGGQKQRISIARELYKDIDILIMDEATSALDSETELAIQQNIDALKGQYTIFMVAHRLSTIKNADHVVLMDKGEIKAQGSYQELLEKSEKFQRMVSLQELVNS